MGMVIVELPRSHEPAKFSKEFESLLSDESITKVFCDKTTLRDIRSLGIEAESESLVNLERLATDVFGPPAGSRGIVRVASIVSGKCLCKGMDINWAEMESKGDSLKKIANVPEMPLKYATLEAVAHLKLWYDIKAAPADPTNVEVFEALTTKAKTKQENNDLSALEREIAAL